MADQLRLLVLAADDQLFGLELEHLAIDGCTRPPAAARLPSPTQWTGASRAEALDGCRGGWHPAGGAVPANHRDDGLLAATLDAIGTVGPLPAQPVVHLDAGYDYQPCRQVLTKRGMVGPDRQPGDAGCDPGGPRWVIERTHAWANQDGKLRRAPSGVGWCRVLAGTGQRRYRLWPPGPPRLDHCRWDGRLRRRP